ncbi:hypothetical protein RRG08_044559 [Elysia crispata]|uniref:Uncharacterized protein n=1 Tax=Elysia crispata TaxID=231223 RepID=A0AAE0ZC07_9GAST|nr:hypothetical protein RRG08_044559 [Elysia crispata]
MIREKQHARFSNWEMVRLPLKPEPSTRTRAPICLYRRKYSSFVNNITIDPADTAWMRALDAPAAPGQLSGIEKLKKHALRWQAGSVPLEINLRQTQQAWVYVG